MPKRAVKRPRGKPKGRIPPIPGKTKSRAAVKDGRITKHPRGRNSVIKIIGAAEPVLGPAAYYGLVGEFIRDVAPFSEATDAGVLCHLLPAIGGYAGPGRYIWAGNRQYARVNTVIVGPTTTGRKGTALAPVDVQMALVDLPFWGRNRVSGLSSGEGLIDRVSDRRQRKDDGTYEIIPAEKRLVVVETEFSKVLTNIRREGNILSQIVREAFDTGNLSTLTINPRHTTGAHICIIGHITPEEVTERLDAVEMANGFANRFLWFYSRSDKVLAKTQPIPGSLFQKYAPRLRSIEDTAKDQPVQLSREAQRYWEDIYPALREDQPGLVGAMTARGSSLVLRLALIYALVDDPKYRRVIRAEHLEAALAVWDYNEQTVKYLFSTHTGSKFEDKIVALLTRGPMTRTDLNRHLSEKQKRDLGPTLEKLRRDGYITSRIEKQRGAGRPSEVYELVPEV